MLAKARLGVLPDDLRLFERLSGVELLTYIGLLRAMDRTEVDRRAAQLLEVLGLTRSAHDLVADYSTGMRKKVALAAALLHGPSVLLLDEPFESVDPVSSRVIVDVLQHYRHSGGTIVFSSHVMDTVERLCDEVAVVSDGAVVPQWHDRRTGAPRPTAARGHLHRCGRRSRTAPMTRRSTGSVRRRERRRSLRGRTVHDRYLRRHCRCCGWPRSASSCDGGWSTTVPAGSASARGASRSASGCSTPSER